MEIKRNKISIRYVDRTKYLRVSCSQTENFQYFLANFIFTGFRFLHFYSLRRDVSANETSSYLFLSVQYATRFSKASLPLPRGTPFTSLKRSRCANGYGSRLLGLLKRNKGGKDKLHTRINDRSEKVI